MIIEGKHSELGQGIFVSDIQEGSNAEKVRDCLYYKLEIHIAYEPIHRALNISMRIQYYLQLNICFFFFQINKRNECGQ